MTQVKKSLKTVLKILKIDIFFEDLGIFIDYFLKFLETINRKLVLLFLIYDQLTY